MHSDLYAYVASCFKYIELMWTTTSNEDHCNRNVLYVHEEAEYNDMDYIYDFDAWTFDTCSPLQLRFSQRGEPGPHSGNATTLSAPLWKCLYVDLLAEDLVVEEDPRASMVVFSMSNTEYRLLVLRSCIIDKKKQSTSIQLRSVYHYSGTRQRIMEASTKLPGNLTSLCESFFFCPSCWSCTSPVYIRPILYDARINQCSTSCKHCAQYCFGVERDPTPLRLKTQKIHHQRWYEPREYDSATTDDSEN